MEGGGYDFGGAKALLADLPTVLEEEAPEVHSELMRMLEDTSVGHHHEGVQSLLLRIRDEASVATLDELSATLFSAVPNLLSLPLRPQGSENHVAGLVADVVERLKRPQRISNRCRILEQWSSRRLVLVQRDDPPAESASAA